MTNDTRAIRKRRYLRRNKRPGARCPSKIHRCDICYMAVIDAEKERKHHLQWDMKQQFIEYQNHTMYDLDASMRTPRP